MTTKTQIYNGALSKIGSERVASTTDGTDQQIALTDQYDVARDATLAAYGWRFATTRAELALSTETPVEMSDGFIYQFALPDDHIRTLELYPGYSDDLKWSEEAGYIITSVDELSIKYTKRETNEALFTAMFIEAFEYRLAALVCIKLKNNRSLSVDMLTMFENTINQAKVQDAKGRSPRKSKQKSSWLRSRTTPVESFVNRIVVT